jgi:hypothetical protein
MSIGTWRDKKIKITEKSKMYLRQWKLIRGIIDKRWEMKQKEHLSRHLPKISWNSWKHIFRKTFDPQIKQFTEKTSGTHIVIRLQEGRRTRDKEKDKPTNSLK